LGMTGLVAALSLTAASLLLPSGNADAQPTPASPQLFTIISTDDPQTQMMALVLTRASRQNGQTVQILLCSDAADLALANPAEPAQERFGPRQMTPRALLEVLVTEGVQTQVCAIYPASRGVTEADLLPGVTQANPGQVATAMAGEQTRLLTF